MCIGATAGLSMLAASFALLMGPPPLDHFAPPPNFEEFPQVGDKRWREDWVNRWNHDQPEPEHVQAPEEQ